MDSQLSSALEFANYTQTLYNLKKLGCRFWIILIWIRAYEI